MLSQSRGKSLNRTAFISDWDKFRDFVKEHGDKTQSEMAQLWDGEISQRTLSRALQKIGHTRKKKHTGTANGMKLARAEFLRHLENPKAPHLVYVDESGMDERDNYGYGYSPCGERFYDLKSGRRQGRINMIAGYRDGQLIAPFTVEGSCNRTVERDLVRNLLDSSAASGSVGDCG
jgi:hypothetical protein